MNNSKPILVVSTKVDKSTESVLQEIERRGASASFLVTEEFPCDSTITYNLSDQSDLAVHFLDYSEYRSVWYRRLRQPLLPENADRGIHEFIKTEAKYSLIGSILALSNDVPTMSSPKAIWAAEHKLMQLQVAKACGLSIPPTMVSNDHNRVLEFYSRHSGDIIAKPVRTGYFEEAGIPKAIYTSKIEPKHLPQLQRVSATPSIFQSHIKKKSDIRVTIVGEKVFSAEIDSQSDPDAETDWRKTSNPNLPHRIHVLPQIIEKKLLRLMRELDLVYGAIDLIYTPDDEYVFLEVNPNGQWLWLDDFLGLGITESIAEWLVNPMIFD